MITYIFYTKDSPSETEAKVCADQLNKQLVKVKAIESNSEEGVELCQLYDIVAYPGVVIADDKGVLIQSWQRQLPSLNEIVFLAHS